MNVLTSDCDWGMLVADLGELGSQKSKDGLSATDKYPQERDSRET